MKSLQETWLKKSRLMFAYDE